MPDETAVATLAAEDQRFEAALREAGLTTGHATALDAFLPDLGEREELALHVAHALAQLSPDVDVRASCAWWAEILAGALARRWPQTAPQPLHLAAEGVVLLAIVLDPATLPPLGPVPELLMITGVDQPPH